MRGADKSIGSEVETLDPTALRELQLRRLRETVERVLRRQPLAAGRLLAAGITAAEDIASLEETVQGRPREYPI